MLPVYKIWHTLLSTRILLSKLLLSFLKRTYVSRNALNLNLLNYNMKILQVAFLLLFNYLDSLPKLHLINSCKQIECLGRQRLSHSLIATSTWNACVE